MAKLLSNFVDVAGRLGGCGPLADVKFAQCELKGVPAISQKSNGDWWLWWVPLPHIGGKPLTYYSMFIHVDGINCAAGMR